MFLLERLSDFTIDPGYVDLELSYRFVFGDRETTDWASQRETTHTYNKADVYTAHGEVSRKVGAPPIETTSVKVSVMEQVAPPPPKTTTPPTSPEPGGKGTFPLWPFIL